MEKAGAAEIFLRSIDSRGLKYCTFVGDGDTGTYGTVRDKCKQVYGGEYPVTKEECVGHIQKRMGSALREYKRKKQGIKLADGKSVGGKGRLTDVLVDKMQNYFEGAIRRNNDSLEGMLSSIWAIFYHVVIDIKSSLEVQHRFCPKSKDSWCKYWSSPNKYTQENRLAPVFFDELLHIFTHLTKEDLTGLPHLNLQNKLGY